MIDLKNKRVLVVGLGKSGLAAARFLKTLGARVTVSDARPAMLIAELSELLEQGFMVEAGSHGLLTFRRQDLIVVSPGVPMSTPELKQVRAMGAHIIGELELGSQYLQGEVVAVTGSNGKTTTTTLIGEILKAAGWPTLVGGNIGRPVTAMVEESVELSGHSSGWGKKQILRLRRRMTTQLCGACWRFRAFSWRRWRRSSRGLRWC